MDFTLLKVRNQFIMNITATNANDAAIENMLREYYFAFDFESPDDVQPRKHGLPRTAFRTPTLINCLLHFMKKILSNLNLLVKIPLPLIANRIKTDLNPFSVSFSLITPKIKH